MRIETGLGMASASNCKPRTEWKCLLHDPPRPEDWNYQVQELRQGEPNASSAEGLTLESDSRYVGRYTVDQGNEWPKQFISHLFLHACFLV